MLQAGQQLGPYTVLGPLGAGGMGEVYRGRDTRLEREVAIKVLPAALAENAEHRARFGREMKTLAALSHPNLLAIYDTGAEAGVAYAVTELLRGETLRARLERGALGWRPAVEIAVALGEVETALAELEADDWIFGLVMPGDIRFDALRDEPRFQAVLRQGKANG